MKTKPYRNHLIPLFAAIPVALLSIFMIYAALRSDGTEYIADFVGFGGTFRYNDIHVFGISLYTFFMLLGLVVAMIVAVLKRRQYGFGIVGALLSTLLFFLQSYLGAKLLCGMEGVIAAHSWQAWDIAGQSLFGVLYISMPVIPLLALLFRKKNSDLFDFFTPACPILLSFIRLGCFTSACCGANMFFIGDSPIMLPVQLFEIICDLVILSLCLWLDRPGQPGRIRGQGIFPTLLVTYCSTRFFLEFIRQSSVYYWGFSLSQIHCIIFFFVGLGWFCFLWDKNEKSKRRAKHH